MGKSKPPFFSARQAGTPGKFFKKRFLHPACYRYSFNFCPKVNSCKKMDGKPPGYRSPSRPAFKRPSSPFPLTAPCQSQQAPFARLLHSSPDRNAFSYQLSQSTPGEFQGITTYLPGQDRGDPEERPDRIYFWRRVGISFQMQNRRTQTSPYFV